MITGADIEASGGNALHCGVPMENRDGSQGINPLRPVLCTDRVRHVGDNVAFVVAETLAEAKDAAELVSVEYESLPVAAETESAAASGQPLVHDDVPGNLSFDWEFGERAAVEAALAKAAHVTRLRVINNRLVANAIEPRAAIAEWDANTGITLHACTQGGWLWTDMLAGVLKVGADKVRILTPDVGGGFGMKAFFYPEYAMAAFAARELGRPVKWTGERSETFLADVMGRDHVTTAELALDADHKILGMRVETIANMGAYNSLFAPFIPTMAALKVLPGVYDVKSLVYRVKGVLTNTTPVDAYRGAGRPEFDLSGRAPGRRRGARGRARPDRVPPPQLHRRGRDAVQDHGRRDLRFRRVRQGHGQSPRGGRLGRLQGAPRRGCAPRAPARHRHGLLHRIRPWATRRKRPGSSSQTTAMVNVVVGTQSNGQGHETAYAQVLNDRLGIPFEKIRIVQGDTKKLKWGGGTGGSRSLTAEGMAIRDASDIVIERGKHYASQELETATADIEFAREAGEFRVIGTDRAVGLLELAAKARTMTPPEGAGPGLPGLDAEAMAKIDAWTFPNGCHVAEIEIDPDTGVTTIVNYVAVDDFGVVLNPMLVTGQVHGGRRPGHRAGALRACGLRRQRPAPVRLVHGLLHAARRRRAGDGGLDPRGAVQEQPDGGQGLRRGGLGRLARGRDQRDHRCALRPRRARDRHARDPREGLAADPGAQPADRGGMTARHLRSGRR